MKTGIFDRCKAFLCRMSESRNSRLLSALIFAFAALCLVLYLRALSDARNEKESRAAADAFYALYESEREGLLFATGGNGLSEKTLLPVGESAVVGTLTLPSLSLTLPVQRDADEGRLHNSPCMASSLFPCKNGCVIAANAYAAQFGRLNELCAGDALSFTNVAGSTFHFTVLDAPPEDGGFALALTNGRTSVYCAAHTR